MVTSCVSNDVNKLWLIFFPIYMFLLLCDSRVRLVVVLQLIWKSKYVSTIMIKWASQVASVVPIEILYKEHTSRGRRLKRHGFHPWVRKIPLEEMATHTSILAWEIPWTEEPGVLQSAGSQRVTYNWVSEHIMIK